VHGKDPLVPGTNSAPCQTSALEKFSGGHPAATYLDGSNKEKEHGYET
jgi:hypothetical protein